MPVLRIGSRGSAVRELQQLLGIGADGIFGSQTHQAVVNFQRKHGLTVDGIVGGQTWSQLTSQSVSQPSPPSQTIYTGQSRAYTYGNAKIIETSPSNIDLRVLRNTLRGSNVNGISGTFFWPVSPSSAQNPNGIIINNKQIIGENASHAWRKYPQSVLCFYRDGSFGIEKVLTAREISKPVQWAIGGVGLLPNYDPNSEGFNGAFADVLRYVTSSQGGHTWIGYKGNKIYLYWRTNCTRQTTLNDARSMGMQGCIGLDGGGSAQFRHPNLRDSHTSRRVHNAIVLKSV